MDTTKKSNKLLTALVAICGSVFLFAACEPRDDRPAEGPADDPAAPTYGEPDRPPAEEDPAAPQQPEADPWEEDAGQRN